MKKLEKLVTMFLEALASLGPGVTLSQSVIHSFAKYYVYCELGCLDEFKGVSDGMQSHANSCKVMQSLAKSCKVMQSHAKSCKVMKSHAKPYKVIQNQFEPI